MIAVGMSIIGLELAHPDLSETAVTDKTYSQPVRDKTNKPPSGQNRRPTNPVLCAKTILTYLRK
jgi:hypothetical protein